MQFGMVKLYKHKNRRHLNELPFNMRKVEKRLFVV